MEGANELLRHLVLIKFKVEITPAEIEEIIKKWADLQGVIPQIKAFYRGVIYRGENQEQRFTHVIEMHFESMVAVHEYLANPRQVDFDKNTFWPSRQDSMVVDHDHIPVQKE